jgi:hypothetical protein
MITQQIHSKENQLNLTMVNLVNLVNLVSLNLNRIQTSIL